MAKIARWLRLGLRPTRTRRVFSDFTECSGGKAEFGGITNWEELKENLAINRICESMLNDTRFETEKNQ